MAGLLSNAKPKEQPTMGAVDTAGGQVMMGSDEEQGNVSPEEQQAYDTFVTNGMQVIYSEKATPKILERISSDNDPVQGLANTLVFVVMRLEDSAKDNGVEISGDVKMHGATELLEQLAELAEQAGVHAYSEEEMEAALYQALDMYREARKDSIPTEELQQDMQMLVEADQQGRLDEVVPGATEFAKSRQAG